MPASIPNDLIWDGFSSLETGMNNGAARQRLGVFEASLLINATARGGFAKQRPGISRVMTVLATPPGQFQHLGAFVTDAGRQFLICVCGGRFYRIDPIERSVLEITIPNDPNPSTLRRGWSVQAETFWLYRDGQSPTLIWTGGSARRAKANEVPPGTVIAYVQGRLWYALPDGLSFMGGDLVRNQDSGTPAYNYRDSILRFTENTFLNEGGTFSVPANSGEITAMAATTILDTSQGQGPLQVLCQQNGFSVNTPVDRDIWKNVTYPIQTESLIGAGCTSQDATINVNSDLWFRAPDGLRSFIIARRQFRDFGNTPQSFEMSGFFDIDQPDLLAFSSGMVFDNRYFVTLSPGYSQTAGVFHRGLGVVDLAPITTMSAVSPPVYDGLWTGLNILAVRNTKEGAYLLVLEDNSTIALWQLTRDSLFDDLDGRIQWTVIPRALFVERDEGGRPTRRLKKLHTADLEYDSIAGQVGFSALWQPDGYPCPTQWHQWDECVPNCFAALDCTKPLVFNTGYNPRCRLPEPPNTCVPGSKRPLRNFYDLTPTLQITGPARLLSARFGATLEQEPKYGPNVCEPAACIPIQCCGIDPFAYHSQGTAGYGSGSGSGSGGSGDSGGGGGNGGGGDGGGGDDGGGGGNLIPNMPFVPGEDDHLCTGTEDLVDTSPIVITDSINGITAPVAINPGAWDPDVYMATFGLPGATAAWAQDIWDQFVATGTPYSHARLVWWATAPVGFGFMAIQVYPGKPGGYQQVIHLNTTIAVQYCSPTT